MTENSLIKKIRKNFEDNHLSKRGDTVLVGVSGGPDSVALLLALDHLKYELGIKLIVAHCNHQLRPGSKKDQIFVKQLSEKLGLSFFTKSWGSQARRTNGSLEERARTFRFNYFKQLSKRVKAHAVALAHTQDDLAETILMRLLRGTGTYGLGGILPKRSIDGITYIRPLINVKKGELLSFLKKYHQGYCIDPTNKDPKFFRNKTRLQLLPLIEKSYNKNIKEVLANLSNTSACDYDFLYSYAHSIFKRIGKLSSNKASVQFSLNSFKRNHPAMQRLLLRQAIVELKGNTRRLTLKHMTEIEDLIENRPPASLVHLPSRINVLKNKKFLTLTVEKI